MNKALILLSFVSIVSILLIGCTESQRGQISEAADFTAQQSTAAINATQNLMKSSNNLTLSNFEKEAIEKIASLKTMDETNISNYTQYVEFADNANSIIQITNEKISTDIPTLDTSVPSYNKITNTISAYTPLIESYNEVVKSARAAKSENASCTSLFREKTAKFGFEFGVVITVAVYGVSYQSVGAIYRGFGLEKLAFSCGSCVAVGLSAAHWAIRGIIVSGLGDVAEQIFGILERFYAQLPISESYPDSSLCQVQP